jgi:transcriptional regulator with XRE-family HTH domain
MLVIEVARRQKGLTQQQLGDQTRIHQTFISQIERGYGLPSSDQRMRLAYVLSVDPAKLLDEIIVTEEETTRG